MSSGTTIDIIPQHAGCAWHMPATCVRPPPGLERLQLFDSLKYQTAEVWTELDNRARVAIHKRKCDMTTALGEAIPELLQAQVLGDLGKVAISMAMSARAGVERNTLMDIAVLTLAENNRCGTRADFDDALKDMFGEKPDATWRSRIYGSVYHALRAHGIPCFTRKKIRHGIKRKHRAYANGQRIPETLVWLGGPG